ncbi:SbcC/MukB-like Walker B domain-containing protein [Methylobacterium iners]|uniref:Chromosome partition protein Smc n=1 Tax=Methylobacterium iners TaxID=418707 RepID=A0ABQ4RT45_9HYPH|nr:SbcC/MukB-like Walker B domain-containing protein [Methylobacterium iners]GJD93941.1 Chromosome partition protein Smc [Methylobacterium iners]
MYRLTDIALSNWYLIRREQIRIRGATALVGPTGAGKSTIFDAVSTVLAGNNASRLILNASASGRSARTVRDYCLGWISDPSEGGRPTREACETLIVLVFENEVSRRTVSVGLALAARAEESRETTLSRFIADGHRFEIADYVREAHEGSFVAPWAEIAKDLRFRADRFEEFRSSGERFTAELLALLREGATAPEPRHFLRTFSNAVAFKPIFDSSAFVRSFVLEPEPLDVARIRQSVENWRRLLETIDELERRLSQLDRILRRYDTWAEASLSSVLDELRAASADLRRRVLEFVTLREKVGDVANRLRIATESVVASQGFVREIDAEISMKKALLSGGAAQGLRAATDARHAILTRDRRDLAARVAALVGIIQEAGKLTAVSAEIRSNNPEALRLVEACARSGLRREAPPEETLRLDGVFGHLLADLVALPDLAGPLDIAAEDAALRARAQEREAQILSAEFSVGPAKAARLSQEVIAFRDELARLGIDAVPICELAEIVDPTWGPALEGLLGNAREALVVQPDELNRAFAHLEARKSQFYRCILVKTTDTARRRGGRFDDGPLSLIKTDDPHAEAFLTARLGGFDLAPNDAALAHMSRAVAPSGRSTSGMAYSVVRPVQLMMTRGNRGPTAEARRNLEHATAEARRLRREAEVLREAARRTAALQARLAEAPLDVGALRQEADAIEGLRRSLATEREAVEKVNSGALEEEIAALVKERSAYLTELVQVLEPKRDALLSEHAGLSAKLTSAREHVRGALEAKRRAYGRWNGADAVRIRLVRPDGFDSLAPAKIRADMRGLDAKDLAALAKATRVAAEETADRARRHGRAAERDLAEYCAEWRTDNPLGQGDAPASFGYAWTKRSYDEVAGHELRRYRDQAVQAEGEMRRLMIEDLLTRLADKFERVYARLDALNERLSSQTFTGQTYAFEATVDRRYAAVHALATEVARSAEAAQALLQESGSENTTGPLVAAIEEITALISGEESASRLADYRNYFVYEIGMRDRSGNRTTMSNRALRGSGGEAQAPFYVAIAASLASAYYPGDRPGDENPGLGLCLLDEAFSKLDIRNSQALVDLYQAWGLQLLIAAPEDKRTTLTEVMDTIVTVYKSPDLTTVRIESEHPLETAKRALAAINPERQGIEGFQLSEAAE